MVRNFDDLFFIFVPSFSLSEDFSHSTKACMVSLIGIVSMISGPLGSNPTFHRCFSVEALAADDLDFLL